jgi:hypothetical protein
MTLIITQFDIPGDGNDWRPYYREGIALNEVLIGNKVNALGIIPAQQVVHIKAPGGVQEFIRFQVSFNIQRKINPEIVRDPELVTGKVINIGYIVNVIKGGGIGHRPAGHIDQVGTHRKPAVDTVVGHHIQHMGPVKI